MGGYLKGDGVFKNQIMCSDAFCVVDAQHLTVLSFLDHLTYFNFL